jgi:hypothetical protein
LSLPRRRLAGGGAPEALRRQRGRPGPARPRCPPSLAAAMAGSGVPSREGFFSFWCHTNSRSARPECNWASQQNGGRFVYHGADQSRLMKPAQVAYEAQTRMISTRFSLGCPCGDRATCQSATLLARSTQRPEVPRRPPFSTVNSEVPQRARTDVTKFRLFFIIEHAMKLLGCYYRWSIVPG